MTDSISSGINPGKIAKEHIFHQWRWCPLEKPLLTNMDSSFPHSIAKYRVLHYDCRGMLWSNYLKFQFSFNCIPFSRPHHKSWAIKENPDNCSALNPLWYPQMILCLTKHLSSPFNEHKTIFSLYSKIVNDLLTKPQIITLKIISFYFFPSVHYWSTTMHSACHYCASEKKNSSSKTSYHFHWFYWIHVLSQVSFDGIVMF